MLPLRSSRVRAVAVALAGLAWVAACGGSHDTTAPAPPVPAVIAVTPGNLEFDALSDTIRLTAAVTDQNGQPMHQAVVAWRSASDSIATVDSTGLVTSVANGSTQITASAGAVSTRATVRIAQMALFLFKVSGDTQTAKMGQAVPAPLVVQAADRRHHGVAGMTIRFGTAGDTDGTVSPDSTVTDSAGLARAVWTLGFRSLQPVATAEMLGRVQGAQYFTATAVPLVAAPTVTGVSPDTLVEGAQAIISGTHFSAVADSDVVFIDGVAAVIVAASAGAITVTVPTFSCQPLRLAAVQVQVSPQRGPPAMVPLRSASAPLHLDIGQEAVIRDPGQFCVRFAPSTGPAESYIMGLSAPAENPAAVTSFQVLATGGLAASPSLMANGPRISAARRPAGERSRAAARAELESRRAQAIVDAGIRRWERAHLLPRMAGHARAGAAAADVRSALSAVVPAVGDTVTLHVPDLTSSDLCNGFTSVRGVVRVVGSAGIWVTDAANPTADSLTQADLQAASDRFDGTIYASDTTWFGHPSDIDHNGRVIILLSAKVNATPRLLGFVFLGDMATTATCAESNGGEIFYGVVPDPDNQTGGGARTRSAVLSELPEVVAHEVTHIIQYSQRVILQSGQPMALWEMEGQATLAEELAGNAALGNSTGQNYGANVALNEPGADWYADEVLKLATYFGDLARGVQAPNAPDQCTVYGNTALPVPCDFAAFYGASWILQRYIGDQYGPGYPGGPAQLTRDWVAKHPALGGTANIAALLGVDYDSLFVRFATALALDDLDNGSGTNWVPAPFRITSWNSASLAAGLAGSGLGWLDPPVLPFQTAASAPRGVRGGSTAYTRLEAAAGHSAASFWVYDPNNGPVVSASLRPALWVVRVR